MRVKLLRLQEREHVLLCAFHHMFLTVGQSPFSAGICRLCMRRFDAGRTTLSALTIQYADYALWQRERLEARVAASTRLLEEPAGGCAGARDAHRPSAPAATELCRSASFVDLAPEIAVGSRSSAARRMPPSS